MVSQTFVIITLNSVFRQCCLNMDIQVPICIYIHKYCFLLLLLVLCCLYKFEQLNIVRNHIKAFYIKCFSCFPCINNTVKYIQQETFPFVFAYLIIQCVNAYCRCLYFNPKCTLISLVMSIVQ